MTSHDIQDLDRVDRAAPLHEAIYQELRARLSRGAMAPGESLSLRSLAAELGGSVTPVRDAVWRLTAEQALTIGETRRISVPEMDRGDILELMRARTLLEPEAAARALPFLDEHHRVAMRAANEAMNLSLRQGDVVGYMANNHAFHFSLYRARPSIVLVAMIENIWVRFGPFMRLMYPGAVMAKDLSDRHGDALLALEAGDEAGLRAAISADIQDGLDWMLTRI
ncbi:GntR family transcriptional regulator [Candidatus Phycosocius spiralis]|uniref:GntR family transcriptional regulator n=1 Tax=Candidatus Phycosocius spiralis TaxID=2815099 RepID=A0ABQ4PV11_9PROT|nr:GntR family transcriptional regulator [Candidatus Phycosocius spiralis]GIU66801.1 GntR family transcriptional regulator [Candidatus Phycosocius spiralis]